MKNSPLKISIFTVALLLQINVAYAASTWIPEYVSGQTVYVDPAMKNHPIAPYNFSSLLSDRLSTESSEGIQYFVIAAQQGDEATSKEIPLGVAKVDRLLPTWMDRPGFPKENYVIIFWVRRSDDLNQGSVGVNAGKIPRQAGVTKELLSDPKGLVIPALKENMPANPEGAMLDIVTNIENKIEDHRENQIREKEAAEAREIAKAKQKEPAKIALQQRQERIFQFEQNVIIWQRRILLFIPFAGGITAIGVIVFYRRSRKISAQFLIDEWNDLCVNASTFYVEIEKQELPKIQLLPLDSDPNVLAEFSFLVELLARFIALSVAGNHALDRAKSYFKNGNFQKAIDTLTHSSIKLENVELDVYQSDLEKGFNFSEEIKASDLTNNLKSQWESIKNLLNRLLELQSFYLKMSQKNSFLSFKESSRKLLDCYTEELNCYNLPEGSFKDDTYGLDVDNLVKEYEGKVLTSEFKFKASSISESKRLLDEASSKLCRLTELIEEALMDKRLGEKSYQSSFDVSELERHLTLSLKALKRCKADFPNEDVKELEKTVLSANKVKNSLLLQYKERVKSAYSNKNFSRAYWLLEEVKKHKKDNIEKLKDIIIRPEKLYRSKNLLILKLNKIKFQNQVLKRSYQIQIDILPWETETLETLTHIVSQLETSLDNAQNEEREFTSSNYTSASSSSSYGSYSGSGDYGGYSGGGDYGSDSGGGDY